MEDKKTWWEKKGWIAVGSGIILLFIISAAVGNSNNIPASANKNTSAAVPSGSPIRFTQVNYPATAAQNSPTVSSLPNNTEQTSESNAENPPRNADGTIKQLEITASAGPGSIAFSSEQNYTNCSNDLTVITVDSNGQPVFTKYTDNYSTGLNLFAGDQHSIAYGSLVDSNGDSLSADIRSGMYGSNTAGNWGITCDQGQYQLTIDTL